MAVCSSKLDVTFVLGLLVGMLLVSAVWAVKTKEPQTPFVEGTGRDDLLKEQRENGGTGSASVPVDLIKTSSSSEQDQPQTVPISRDGDLDVEPQHVLSNLTVPAESTSKKIGNSLSVVAVACGTYANVSIALMTSVVRFGGANETHPIAFYLFTDTKENLALLEESATAMIRRFTPGSLAVRFVVRLTSRADGDSLFKLCASARLRLPELLRNLKRVLYIDTDAIVVGSLRELWDSFQPLPAVGENRTYFSASYA